MRRKTEVKHDIESEAFDRYLDAIGAGIIELYRQMEEVN